MKIDLERVLLARAYMGRPGSPRGDLFCRSFRAGETYNVPGTQNEENWTLRVPPDFARRYQLGKSRGEVLNLHAVLAMALRARPDIAYAVLIARLEMEADWTID